MIAEKYPSIDGISLDEAQAILKTSQSGILGLAEVIRVLNCDATLADTVLRNLAAAGFLEPVLDRCPWLVWGTTALGRRLCLEKKRKRIDRNKVDYAISQLIKRADLINSDPARLQRITLRLFGSALEQQEDYGDIDIAISYEKRQLPDKERLRIEAALKTQAPDPSHRNFIENLFAAENQDKREIRAFLLKGLPHVSLMSDDPLKLGTPFRWLVDHDNSTDKRLPVSEAIVRPNVPSQLDEEANSETPIPPQTIMKAKHREVSPTSKFPVVGLHMDFEDAYFLEERKWTPLVDKNDNLVPNNRQSEPRLKFAGFQHLCEVWKRPMGGVDMMRCALEWGEEYGAWTVDLVPRVSISRGYKSNVIRVGIIDRLMYVRVGKKKLQGSLMPVTRSRVSKIDLAASFAVGQALAKMYREARCSNMPAFSAEIYLPSLQQSKLPDFPKLQGRGEFRDGAFEGLIRAQLIKYEE